MTVDCAGILLFVLDDTRADLFPYMRHANRLPFPRTFTNMRVECSLCDPSRTSLLMGQFSNNTGIVENLTFLSDYADTFPAWLQTAGWETAHFGKLGTLTGSGDVAGLDTMRILNNTGGGNYQDDPYGYKVWDGDNNITPGTWQDDYLGGQCAAFVAAAPEPWYAQLALASSHGPWHTKPSLYGRYNWVEWDVPTGEDVSDKPAYISGLTDHTSAEVRTMQTNMRRKINEVVSADIALKLVLDALPDPANTIVIVTSDNGGMVGEHRLDGPQDAGDKNYPYEPSLRATLVCSGPGFTRGTSPELTTNVDITATIVDISGATPTVTLDGESLYDVQNSPGSYTTRHTKHRGDKTNSGSLGVDWEALVTPDRKYIANTGQAEELYDLTNDPDELVNRANDGGSWETERAALAAELAALY